MAVERKNPGDLASRMAQNLARTSQRRQTADGFRRETFTLSREMAREKAREWFSLFPRAAYMTEIESWRELADGRIEFTMRRLPTAD
jgi:hypothetical protein